MRVFEPEHEDEGRLESLILAYDETLSGGAADACDTETTLPEPLETRFRGMQAALRLLEQARLDGFSNSDEADISAHEDPGVGDPMLDIPSIAGQQVGRFELLRELGRGEYGVVFLAYDPRLGRQVALKIPRPEVLLGSDTRRRFLREAQAAGVLEHPNLIPIYEMGEDGPFCYLATAYCDGPTLAQWLQDRSEEVPAEEAARLVRAVACGVEHAHQRGVLHRDIKPSNVLLSRPEDERNEEEDTAARSGSFSCAEGVSPRLTDFGLAKLLELAVGDTGSGALLGTPAYMAPEQAEGRLRDIGRATDIYALGVLLYELLAGRPPLRGDSDAQTLQQVSRGEVPPLARFRARVPLDLEAIVIKCLERDPQRRYSSAGALAADLERFLAGKPTWARPAGSLAKLLKWGRRRPAVATLCAATLFTTLALAGGGWWFSSQLRTALARVEAHETGTRHLLYVASLNRAERALASNQVEQAREQLAPWIPQPGETDLRNFAWHYLWRQLHEEEQTLVGHTGDVYAVRYSPDGSRLATASQDGTARIWNAVDGRCLRILKGHQGDVTCVAYSPDGKQVATTGDDGTTRVWNVETGEAAKVLPAREGPTWGIAYSPDGTLLAASGTDQNIVLWETNSWTEAATLKGHKASVGALAFSHHGKLLATAGDDNAVCLWDVATRKVTHRLPHPSVANSVAFDARDERLLTTSKDDRTVRLWEPASGKFLGAPPAHYEVIHAVAFAGDSNEQYVVATKEGVVELIHGSQHVHVRRLRGHTVRVWSLAFAPDGRHMATASADRTVKIWGRETRNPEMAGGGTLGVYCVATTADGRLTAIGNHEGGVEIYDHATQRVVWHLPSDCDVVGDFNGDRRRDSGYYVDGYWRLRMASDPDNPRAPLEHSYAFGTNADVPIVGDWDGDGCDDLGLYRSSEAWFLNKSGSIETTQMGPLAGRPLFAIPLIGRWGGAKNDRIGMASLDAVKRSWLFQLQGPKGIVRHPVASNDVHAAPLGGRWQTGSTNGLGLLSEQGIWIERRAGVQPPSTAKGGRTPRYVPLDKSPIDQLARDAARDRARPLWRVHAVAISPRGDRMAVSRSEDTRVKVWDVARRERIAQWHFDSEAVRALAYAPDGATLAVGGTTGELVLHDSETFEPQRRIQAHATSLTDLEYSTDGQVLATAGDQRFVKLWDRGGNLLAALRDDEEGIASIAISKDRKLLAATGKSRFVTVWNLESGAKLAVLAGHNAATMSVTFSPDGGTLASGDAEGVTKLWDLATRQEIYTLARDQGGIECLAFTLQGRRLVVGGYKSPVHLALRVWTSEPAGPQGVEAAR